MPKTQLIALRKMSLVNLATAEPFEVMFNPTDFEEKVSVKWKRVAIPGMSHELLQYENTSNVTFGFEFFCRATNRETKQLTMDFRNFILALCYPSEGATSVPTGAPPRVLVVWPRLLSMTCVVQNVAFKNEAFDPTDLSLLRLKANVDFEEIRDVRLTSESVRTHGHRRADPGTGAFGDR